MKHDLFVQTLVNEFHERKLAHAFLVQTNQYDKTYNSILNFIKMINCPSVYKDECDICNLCRLVDSGNLPSLIVIEPDGNVIKKEQLLSLKDSFKTKPVFSKYNIYIIKNAELLNSSSANTILKFLEEPEDDIIGFFITNNKDNVMETIQSRCQILFDYYDDVSYLDKLDLTLVFDFLNNYKQSGLLYNKNFLISKFESRVDYLNFLKNLFYVFEHLLDVSLNVTDLKYIELSFLLNKGSDYYISWLNLISKYLRRVNYNINILLSLDSFVLEAQCL